MQSDRFIVITDIDHTLIGSEADNRELSAFVQFLQTNRHRVVFGVATGRTHDSAVEILQLHGLPFPDVVISSVGTEIFYRDSQTWDDEWSAHIDDQWHREHAEAVAAAHPFLLPQSEGDQSRFKLSYLLGRDASDLEQVRAGLASVPGRYTLVYSSGKYVDIIPHRASKGTAIEHVRARWGLPRSRFLVFGDSRNDEDMLTAGFQAVVVGNHYPEIAHLRAHPGIYFAKGHCASGILEGLRHHRVIPAR